MTVEATNQVNTQAQTNPPGGETAADMVSALRSDGALDTTTLAAQVNARTEGDPAAREQLVAQVELQLTPVERGQFAAAQDAANDNGTYMRSAGGETFQVGNPDAPAVSTWGSQPEGSAHRDAWNNTAAAIRTNDPAAVTAALEQQLYGPAVTGASPTPTPTPAASTSEEGIGSFFEGAIAGDFSDNNSWSRTAGQVAMGFVPIAGQIADIRDIGAAGQQIWNGEEGGWGNLGLSALGIIPGLGDLAKGALRGGARAVDGGTEVAEQVVRHSDDVARQGDEVAGAVDNLPVRRFDNADDFNRAANDAAPNTVYTHGNFSYRTDAQGRVSSAEGRIEVAPAGRNDPELQSQIGREGRPTDVGFHIFADRFGAQTNRLNVVPGNGRPIGDNLPNLNQGPYKRFENMLADLASTPGNRVDARIEMQYDVGNASARPDRFVAHFRVNDGMWVQQIFVNK